MANIIREGIDAVRGIQDVLIKQARKDYQRAYFRYTEARRQADNSIEEITIVNNTLKPPLEAARTKLFSLLGWEIPYYDPMQEPPLQEVRLPVQDMRAFSPWPYARVPSQIPQEAVVGQSQSVPSIWESPGHLAFDDGIAGIYYDIDGNDPQLVAEALVQLSMPPQEPAAAAAAVAPRSIAFDDINMLLGQE